MYLELRLLNSNKNWTKSQNETKKEHKLDVHVVFAIIAQIERISFSTNLFLLESELHYHSFDSRIKQLCHSGWCLGDLKLALRN